MTGASPPQAGTTSPPKEPRGALSGIDRYIPGLLKALIGVLAAQCLLGAVNLILPPDMSRASQASAVALDRNGVWLRALPVDDGRWRIRADLSRTDPVFQRHLLAVEDERFYWHPGVDVTAILRAFGSNARAGRVVSGGSTITMQTARLLEPHERSYGAKIFEMLRALQLELRYTKRDILGLYLTLAPYGGNLEGVRAASLSYFGHEPLTLTLPEQALLIALPQSPEARRPDKRPESALRARNIILNRLADTGEIPRSVAIEAMHEPMVTQRIIFPAIAWHAAGRLARRAEGLQATVHTTIDANLQSRLETLAAETARAQGPNASVAILVVELEGRAVRASVGSGGLDRPGGWIDMTRALRSPGSTLKPFIYGFGFEDGVLAPDTRMNDAPTRFGDYQPENFDRIFHGPVTAREALIHSLNVPAVAILNRIGPDAFQARIEGAGVRLVRPKAGLSQAGLALALGGEGIRLDDIALLYAGLGDHGLIKPLAYTQSDARTNKARGGYRLMQADAADKVIDILRETPAPTGRLPGPLMRAANRPAYKTGTSYGFRDALAVGVAGGYAVLVWTGRPDGGARADMTGREASAPLLFDVFDQINAPPQLPSARAPDKAPAALTTLRQTQTTTSILFPPNNATVYVESLRRASDGSLTPVRPLKLSGRSSGAPEWYVNGEALTPEADGTAMWWPKQEGFYDVRLIDAEGHEERARVRIMAIAPESE